jgi:hypothetical protein
LIDFEVLAVLVTIFVQSLVSRADIQGGSRQAGEIYASVSRQGVAAPESEEVGRIQGSSSGGASGSLKSC